MKILKMKVDNIFLSGEKEPKPVFNKLFDISVSMRAVDTVVPFEKHGTTFFMVTMKDGEIYHARYDIEIVRE